MLKILPASLVYTIKTGNANIRKIFASRNLFVLFYLSLLVKVDQIFKSH